MTESDEVRVVAHLRAKPGQEAALRAILKEMIGPSQAEPGCRHYIMHEDRDEPGVIVFYEAWADQKALDAHMATPHFRAMATELPGLLDGPLSVTKLRVVAGS